LEAVPQHAPTENALDTPLIGGDKTCPAQAPLTNLRCETGVKDIQICIRAAADPERATITRSRFGG